jgi:Fe-S-cluster containining protein
MHTEQAQCKRCGICCTKGGPALHKNDLDLVERGVLPIKMLITIRKGELVFKPDDDIPQPARCELIKISGTGKDWRCLYYDVKDKGCMIYQDRPQSCNELECWNTQAVEQLIEKDTLSRFDIVGAHDPVYSVIIEHESSCACPDLNSIREALLHKNQVDLNYLERLINDDIAIRTATVRNLNISLAEELFYFGRPIFQLLQQIGIAVIEREGKLKLRWPV